MSGAGYSLTELNKPDWANLTDMDRKHTPVIEAPDSVEVDKPFEVTIKVGGIDGVEHPNMLGHWITWLELYVGERYIGKVEFAPEVSNGYKVFMTIALKESGNLRARAFCNLHGLWEGKGKPVSVR